MTIPLLGKVLFYYATFIFGIIIYYNTIGYKRYLKLVIVEIK